MGLASLYPLRTWVHLSSACRRPMKGSTVFTIPPRCRRRSSCGGRVPLATGAPLGGSRGATGCPQAVQNATESAAAWLGMLIVVRGDFMSVMICLLRFVINNT